MGVGVDVEVDVEVGVAVAVFVGVAVLVGVNVGVDVDVDVLVGVDVDVDVLVGVKVAVAVDVAVAAAETDTLGCAPLMLNTTDEQLVLPNALVVHVSVPVVEAVDVKVMTTVPLGSTVSGLALPERVVAITPPLTEGVVQLSGADGPGSIAVTPSDPAVMASPVGTDTATQSSPSLLVLVFVTVTVYKVAAPLTAEVGDMATVNSRASVNAVVNWTPEV